MSEEDPLVLIDKAMILLERLEEEVGRLAEAVKLCKEFGGPSISTYSIYSLVLELSDVLRLLRKRVFEVCGGSAAAGPQHETQR